MKKKILLFVAATLFVFTLVLNISLDSVVQKDNQSLLNIHLLQKVMGQSESGGSPNCGPLYGNSGGTSFCCGNSDSTHCYAAAC